MPVVPPCQLCRPYNVALRPLDLATGCVDASREHRYIYTFKQYPTKEQAELRVRVKLPGSWFDNLTSAERTFWDPESLSSL